MLVIVQNCWTGIEINIKAQHLGGFTTRSIGNRIQISALQTGQDRDLNMEKRIGLRVGGTSKNGGTCQTRVWDRRSGRRVQGGNQDTSAGGVRLDSIQKDDKEPPRRQRTLRGRCCTRPALPPPPRGGAATCSSSSEPSSPSKPSPVCSTSSAAGWGQRVSCWQRRGWWRQNTPEQYGQWVIIFLCLTAKITMRRFCSLATTRSLRLPNSSCKVTISSFMVSIQVFSILFPSIFNK